MYFKDKKNVINSSSKIKINIEDFFLRIMFGKFGHRIRNLSLKKQINYLK